MVPGLGDPESDGSDGSELPLIVNLTVTLAWAKTCRTGVEPDWPPSSSWSVLREARRIKIYFGNPEQLGQVDGFSNKGPRSGRV